MSAATLFFSIIHLGLYAWTRDPDFITGATVFLAAFMVIEGRA